MDVPRWEVREVNLLWDKWPGITQTWWTVNIDSRDNIPPWPTAWTRTSLDSVFSSLPVGLRGVVLVRPTDGFLHPIWIDPPQLQRVVHSARHNLFTEEIKVLQWDKKNSKKCVVCVYFGFNSLALSNEAHCTKDFISMAFHAAKYGY